jgi:hypothetical protein
MKVEHKEVTTLVIDLSEAPSRLADNLDSVFANEADALLRDMRRDAAGHRFLPNLPSHLRKWKLGPLSHEVGFVTGDQGSIAHIIVNGSVNNAPVYDFYGPLTRRTEPFVRHIANIAEDSIFTTGAFRR